MTNGFLHSTEGCDHCSKLDVLLDKITSLERAIRGTTSEPTTGILWRLSVLERTYKLMISTTGILVTAVLTAGGYAIYEWLTR